MLHIKWHISDRKFLVVEYSVLILLSQQHANRSSSLKLIPLRSFLILFSYSCLNSPKWSLPVRFYIRFVLFPSSTSRPYDIATEYVVRDRKQRLREIFSVLRTGTCEPRHKSESFWRRIYMTDYLTLSRVTD
jgi:hypothetical protein